MKKSFKIVVGIIVVITFLIIISNVLFISINYDDNSMPGSNYRIKISRITRKMTVKEYHSCSAVGCDNKTVKNKVTLTKKEFSMIKKILKTNYRKEHLSSALSSIAENNKVFCKKGDSSFEEKKDLNKDGIVTSREFGVSFLKDILQESN